MDTLNLTSRQLRQAADIKAQIEKLNGELRHILGGTNSSNGASAKKRTVSAATKRRIAAAQKARWAKQRQAKSESRSAKLASKKKVFSAATRRKLSARLKAYWAAKKAAKK